ncbi:MAG: hypothetical protein IJJ13_02705 [Lachnospiraceae bacterium]|nr:hypothetical protein [Lachnospiraceae bacterium]
MKANDGVSTNRKLKDTLFRKLFGEDKATALSLYNAVNGTSHPNPEDLEFTTLEDVIWMKVKNDVSFAFTRSLNLYEHQSTYNPNMPLRGLLYFADLYRQLIPVSEKLYSQQLMKIATPKYVVFYNGERDAKDREVLKLSSAFEDPSAGSDYEWTATMLNINYGHNAKLIEKCETLREYSRLIFLIREYQKKEADFDEAVSKAVDDCIKEGTLSEFLQKHRREVRDMCLTEFDEKKFEQVVKDDARAFTIFDLVQKDKLSVEDGAEELNMDLADFERAMQDNGYKIPVLA